MFPMDRCSVPTRKVSILWSYLDIILKERKEEGSRIMEISWRPKRCTKIINGISIFLNFGNFFWASFHSLSSPTLGSWPGEGFYIPDPCDIMKFTFLDQTFKRFFIFFPILQNLHFYH